MKPAVKNFLIIGGLLVTALAVAGAKKLKNLQYAFSMMTISQHGWIDPSKVELIRPFKPDGIMRFKTNVILVNKSLEDFSLNGGYVASLTKLAFIYNGTTIGFANVYINTINVPAVGQTIIENIPVELPTANILNNIANIPDMVNKFKIIGYVDVLGTEYIIGA